MRSRRYRVNLSLDGETYESLKALQADSGCRSVCEVVTAFVRILLDQRKSAEERTHDLPEDDSEYIREMFDRFGSTMDVPDGEPPRYHKDGHRKL